MHLPSRFAAAIPTFAPVFRQRRTWRRAELLLIGAIRAPGKRTVTSLLRIAGLGRERRFSNYHRVLNRAAWDARAAARLLLGLLIAAFAPAGPVALGIDDTIERRRGKRIAAKGIYRDPVRSSKGHFVKASGLRWLSLMLLAALARGGLICITRLRLDAALHEPAPPREPGTIGRPRAKGARLPNLAVTLADEHTRWAEVTVPGWYGEADRVIEYCSATAVWRHAGLPVVPIRWVLLRDPRHRFDPQALLCADPARDPLQVVRWSVQRWRVEVTLREARAHLGVETQRQWSDRAVARTTPCLLALFSIVRLFAARLDPRARSPVCTAAWYRKRHPTFADTLAAVRRQFWREQGLLLSWRRFETTKRRPALRHGIAYALCHAA